MEKKKHNFKKLALRFACVLAVASFSTQAFAIGGGGTGTVSSGQSESVNRLNETVESKLAENTYHTTEGDGVKGNQIINQNGEITSKFDELQESDKTQVLKDIKSVVDDTQKKDTDAQNSGTTVNNAVTKGTVHKFWTNLRETNGTVAGYLISAVTAPVQVDFNSAMDLLEPFIPFFNTGMGVFLLLGSLSFFLSIAIDVFYFLNPLFQAYIGMDAQGVYSAENGMKKLFEGAVSARAKNCLMKSFEKQSNPIISYFFSSWSYMLAFGLVLVFFAGNSMLALVGPIVNLLYQGFGL